MPSGTADLPSRSDQEFSITPPAIAAAVDLVPTVAAIAGDNELAGSLSIPPLPRKVNRLIVAAQSPGALVAPDVEYVTSLAAACRRANELNLSEVELHFNGRHEEVATGDRQPADDA